MMCECGCVERVRAIRDNAGHVRVGPDDVRDILTWAVLEVEKPIVKNTERAVEDARLGAEMVKHQSEVNRLRAQSDKYGKRARIWSYVAIAFAVASIVINILT
jgi:hypothetical protein